MDAADRRLFSEALRDVTAKHAGRSLDHALTELGWEEALADEPRTATSLLFEQQGLVNATSSALSVVVGGDPTTLLPRLGGCVAPGELTTDGFAVNGLATTTALAGSHVLVVVQTADGAHVAGEVPVDALITAPAEGMDPAAGLVRVSTTSPVSLVGAVPRDWEAAVADAQRALAHELVGVSRAMLQLARDHAVDRVQGGRSIASFQAVRHRLADCVVAIESADAAAAAAWEAPSPDASVLAKAIAGTCALTVARHAQQVLAGMGFTREHGLHLHVRRAFLLDGLLGSSRRLTREIGRRAVQTRALPDLVPL